MSKITIYNKLVRDNIPVIIKSNGGKPKYRYLENDEEFKKALKVKLVEEIDELLNAKTEVDAIEELGDIWTVLLWLDIMYEDAISMALDEKINNNGNFSDRIFLESVEFEEDVCDES